MCKCSPNVKTPFCGKPGCELPAPPTSGEPPICPRCRALPTSAPGLPCMGCASMQPAQPSAAPLVARPKIVCLCGSTRFYEHFMHANYEETMKGNIVLSVGFFMHRPAAHVVPRPGEEPGKKFVQPHGQSVGCTPEQKIALDELHKRKIDLADEVLVLNVGGYIGDSTRSEVEYAEAHGKVIRWLEPLEDAHV